MAQPHMLAAVGTGEDERACRIGFMGGNFVKRFCTVGWVFVGLIVAAAVVQGAFGALVGWAVAAGLSPHRVALAEAAGGLMTVAFEWPSRP